MGKPTGFMEIARAEPGYLPVAERIHTYQEFLKPFSADQLSDQGARCMDCGVPFCQTGCPVNNSIPDWNDLVYHNRWREALETLHSTNNFPEFTGRICPAPCEAACVLNIDDAPVTIKSIERAIVDRGWAEGWIAPQLPTRNSGKRVAVVGGGPSGLACAQQLARAGHGVVLFDKHDRIGGLMRYGIPDFKMEKHLIDRRLAQMQAEGVEFRPGTHIGVDVPARQLLAEFDALVVCAGSEQPRDLNVPGRELKGIYFALQFLQQNNKRVAGDPIPADAAIHARGKHVVVIGGGDTGSDCVGTSIRHGAASVTQYEVLARPPVKENKATTWPNWPLKMRTSSSHEEGCERDWSISTKSFSGADGVVTTLHGVRLDWQKDASGAVKMVEIAGSEFAIPADLVLLATGYLHPVHAGMLAELGVELDARGNARADTERYQTSVPKVFAAGDTRRGQSLVVWAIREGRQAARAVDEFLMGRSELPR